MRHIQPDERIKSCGTKLGFCVREQKEKKKTEEKAEWIKMERTGDRKSDIMTVMRAGFVKDYVLCREEASFFHPLFSIQRM